MGDRIRGAASRCHREAVEHNNHAESRWNAENRSTYSFTEQVTRCGGHVSKRSHKIVIQATANHVVDLSWKASTSTDVAGYNIYRAPDGVTWKKINASLIASALYSDSTVANGSTYYYAATAVDIHGHESSKTAVVKAIIP